MAKKRRDDDGTMALVVIGGGILIWYLLGQQPAGASGLWGILDIYRMPDGSLTVAWRGCPAPTGGILLSSVTLSFSTAGQTITGSDGTFTIPAPCPTAQQVPAPEGEGGGSAGSGGGGGGTGGGPGMTTVPGMCGQRIQAAVGWDGSGALAISDAEALGIFPKFTTPEASASGDPMYASETYPGSGQSMLTGYLANIQQTINAGLYPPGGGIVAPVSAAAGYGLLNIVTNCRQLPVLPEFQGRGNTAGAFGGAPTACEVRTGDWINAYDRASVTGPCGSDVARVRALYGNRDVVRGVNGMYYVAPTGNVWLPLPSDVTPYGTYGQNAAIAVPGTAAGVPAGNYLPILNSGKVGSDGQLQSMMPYIIKQGQMEKTLASIMAEREAKKSGGDDIWMKIISIIIQIAMAYLMSGCWVAEALYGRGTPEFHAARSWIFGRWRGRTANLTRALYLRHGHRVAGWVRRFAVVRALLRPLFDVAVRRGSR